MPDTTLYWRNRVERTEKERDANYAAWLKVSDELDDALDRIAELKGERDEWIEAAKYEKAEKLKAYSERNAAVLLIDGRQ